MAMSDPVHRFRMAMVKHLGKTVTPEVAAAVEAEAYYVAPTPIAIAQFAPMESTGYTIRAERFADVLEELQPLHEAHWQETERWRHGLTLNPNVDAVLKREAAGRVLQVTLRHQGALVGQLRMFIHESLHTQTPFAEEDCLFVMPEHRGGVRVMKMIRYTENCLRTLGISEVRCNSKLANRADVLMRRMRYEPVALQFCKFLEPQ